MTTLRPLIFALFIFIAQQVFAQNTTTSFDKDWRFHLGGFSGGEQPAVDDSKWRSIDLPHDWSIENRPGTNSPFNKDAVGQVNEGFTSQGTAWYRKTFTIPQANKNKHIVIQFDGVYMNSDVYVNGQYVGNHPYGYTSFYYDITPQLKFGDKNIIAVEVKNEGQNSRWYTGSGVYRHVWLKTLDPVHIVQWSTFISASEISEKSAKVNFKTRLINESVDETPVVLTTRFVAPDGTEVGKINSELKLHAGEKKEVAEDVKIANPVLWSCETPALYKAVTEIDQNGKIIGTEQNTFGVRSISFDTKNGFQLNGKTVKLKGGCFHNDDGPLGARAFDRAEERKVELLKASGYDAIRCSHNPPSPAFLDACDRLGMLVIDEAFDMWNYGKNPYDYHLYFEKYGKSDLESMVIRDRNHPSIIMWSIGNEIPERATAEGVQTAKTLGGLVKELDPTRVITAAVNGLNPDKDPFFGALDIAGYNYALGGDHLIAQIYAEDHKRVPERIMFGSESYPLEAFNSWIAVEDTPYVIGDFVWTAWDYIGEASIGWLGYPQSGNFYPWNLAFCGDIDICGWKRPQSYYRDALWKKDQLSIFVSPPAPSFKENPNKASWSKWNWADVLPDWNWKGYENKPLEVTVYSSCERVELFLNGKSLGVKPTGRSNKYMATWKVPYSPGELKAIGYDADQKVNTSALHTAGKPVLLKLIADRQQLEADRQDLSYVAVELVDGHGNLAPKASDQISFSITGDAKIIGVGNANPRSLESYQSSSRKAWKGKCLVIIQAGKKPGNILLTAKAPGIRATRIDLKARDPASQ